MENLGSSPPPDHSSTLRRFALALAKGLEGRVEPLAEGGGRLTIDYPSSYADALQVLQWVEGVKAMAAEDALAVQDDEDGADAG